MSPERSLTIGPRRLRATRRGAVGTLLVGGAPTRRLRTWFFGALLGAADLGGCRGQGDGAREGLEASAAAALTGAASTATLTTAVAALRPPQRRAAVASDAGVPPLVRVSELAPAAPADACPAIMAFVPGGEFWMGGASRRRGARAEQPRFLTRVADFCLDTYEVTTASYEHCVRSGACTASHGSQSRCNDGRREDHPINCVDWGQADTFCKAQGARLPTELEWEYAARGGAKYFQFSWGFESPEGRTCWKGSQTCPVGSFGAGAFGLHDMSGNVWEWTNDWFGDYPTPTLNGRSKVFRGGGWSGRFDKWLDTTLRNRSNPERWGSYLGFRCARLARDAVCPFGAADEAGVCRQQVLDVACSDDQTFDGQRCAAARPSRAGARRNRP